MWEHIKGNIARKYSLRKNLSVVKQRLDEEFEKLHSPEGGLLVQRIVSNVNERIEELERKIREEDRSQFPVTVLEENDYNVTDSVESIDL